MPTYVPDPHDPDLERRITRSEFWRRILVLSVVLTFIVLISGLVTLSLQIRRTQETGSPIGKRIVGLTETIEGCVNPGGTCYQRSRKNQAEAIATLNLGALYAVYCVDRYPRASIAEVQACVRDLYRSSEPKRPDR